MQRLDMMWHLARQAQAKVQAKGRRAATTVRRGPRPGAQAVVLAWFSLGVLTSGAAGVGALMGLRALEAGGTPVTWRAVGETLGAARRPDRAWNRAEIAIDRSARAIAPLGLEVTGAGALPFEVILDGVPAGVRLSRGAPVAPSTWVVGRADLKGLHLILDDAAPETFELRIAVTAPTGVATRGSIVQVHLIDRPRTTQTAAVARSDRRRAAPASPPVPRR